VDPIRNPYAPGAGQRPPELAGRDDQLRAFNVVLERVARSKPERSVVLTGLRGVGKTVLLNALRGEAVQRAWGTGKVEARPDQSIRLPLAQAVHAAGPGGTNGSRPVAPDSERNARWRAALASGSLLADGAMGTMLFAEGLQFGDPPEVWNLSHPEVVRRIHRGYLDAGSQILMTNTFGGNRLRLSLHGLEHRVAELNRTAAVLLRSEVDAAGGSALVAGDIGPSGAIMAPVGTLEVTEAVEIFAEQAAALIAGGVDLIWIETMSDLGEIRAAVQGVRSVSADIPIVTTMTFDTRGHTMMGVSPEQAVRALWSWGVDAVGGNCGNGPDELIPVVT